MLQSNMYRGLYRETDRRTKERIIGHNKREKSSHILKDSRKEKVTVSYGTKVSKYLVTIIVQLSNGRLVRLYS